LSSAVHSTYRNNYYSSIKDHTSPQETLYHDKQTRTRQLLSITLKATDSQQTTQETTPANMPPYKKKAPSASSSRNANATAKAKASPYNKNTKDTSTGAKKTHSALASKPTQARNKHKNMNLTSELDSLLGDLNTQLQRKKTKRDVRSVSRNPMDLILQIERLH
jgi:hypothetical protein